MLIINNLTKQFGEKIAVQRVTCSVHSGEIFSLIGPNGSGKTTIIKMVAGLLYPNGGTIQVLGNDVTKEPLKTKACIGYIPDEPTTMSGMTGEELLHFMGALYGVDAGTRAKKIPELLSQFHLAGIEKEYFENYSRGNRQKFVILGAFLHNPKLLLVDEPIVGLDPESATVVKRMLTDFAKSGGAILMATHTLPVAESIATKIGILKNGKLVTYGTLADLRIGAKRSASAMLEEIYTVFTTA